MRLSSIVVFLATLVASLPAQQMESRTYDLRTLLGTEPEMDESGAIMGALLAMPVVPPLAAVSAASDGEMAFDYPSAKLRQASLAKCIQRCLGKAGESEYLDGRLYLRALPAIHERVGDLLAALEESLRPEFELELHFLTGEIPVMDSVLAPRAAAELLRSHPPAASHRSQIVGDVPARLRTVTHQNFVRDYDVEVAEKSSIYDPKIDVFREGLAAGILATTLADGRIQVTFAIQESELARPMKVSRLRGHDRAQVHQPAVRSRTIAGSGILEAGGALVLGSASESRGVCVVRLKRVPQPPRAPRPGRYHAVPLGDLTHPSPVFYGAKTPSRPGEEPRLFQQGSPLSAGSYLTVLSQILGEPDPEFGWEVLGNHVLVHGSETEPDRLRGKLKEWAAARQTYRLEVRAGRVSAADAKDYLADSSKQNTLIERVPRLGGIAALPGRSFLLMDGDERKCIRDFDVEIAQKAQAANPVMGTTFAGISFAGALLPTASGASLTGRFLLATSTLEAFDLSLERARDVDLERSAFVDQDLTAVRIHSNAWKVLLVLPTREKDYAVLAVRLTRD